MRLAGKDVTNTAFELPAADAVPLEITLAASSASVEGTVINNSGAPVANTMVIAVPNDESAGQTDPFHRTVADQQGFFSLRGVKPGVYDSML